MLVSWVAQTISPKRIARYVDAGVNHYEMKFVYHSVDHLLEQLEHFASAVMPTFR